MEKRRTSLAEFRRLYEKELLTLRQIADRFDVTWQAVHSRLVLAGVKMRSRAAPRTSFGRKLLIRLYVKKGLTLKEVGAELGVSGTLVARELKRHGIKRRPSGPPPSKVFKRNLIYRLYVTDGRTIAQVGAKLGVSVRIIARELIRHNIDVRHRHVPPSKRFDRDLLETLYVAKRMSIVAVGSKLGASRQTVTNELKRHGIDLRKPGQRPMNLPETNNPI